MRPLQPGLTLRSYRLEHMLGFGASGQVWLAHDTRGREVALKACPKGEGDDQQFRREFEKLRTLRLPGVVRVLDAGSDQGYLFFTMDVARGVPFDVYVQQGDTLDAQVQRAAAAGAQVARALAAIHNIGLAHRDIKPANVLVDTHGRATVLDFGTARFGATHASTTSPTGTAAYMAPELRVGLPHDARVDLYALGVMLHQALSGVAPARFRAGRPRPSLTRLGAAVPLGLAWLVDRLLHLDPVLRPSAADAETVLAAIATADSLSPAPWPSPSVYTGDPSLLLSRSAVVHGPPGTGRRRMVQEARWHWFRKGYRSVGGRCQPDRPYGALRDILAELFAGSDGAARRALAGDDAALLAGLWPELPVPVDAPAAVPVPPREAARALHALCDRAGPLALVFWNLDQADVGTEAVVRHLAPLLSDRVRLWATARAPYPALDAVRPPPWGPDDHEAVCRDLLPSGAALPPAAETPLGSVSAAWRVLAGWRAEPGPAAALSPELVQLSALEEPFPAQVAAHVVGRAAVRRLLRTGQLVAAAGSSVHLQDSLPPVDLDEVTETSDLFRRADLIPDDDLDERQPIAFADRGTRLLARAALGDPAGAHREAAAAWGSVSSADAPLLAARHALLAGAPTEAMLQAAIRQHLDRGNPGEVDRWLRLRRLLFGPSSSFLVDYARLYTLAELHPTRLDREAIRALGRRARGAEERGLAGYLLLMHDARTGDRDDAIARGRDWAARLKASQPLIAANMLREVALARLASGAPDQAVEDCREALGLARAAAAASAPVVDEPTDPPLTQAEVGVATTMSAGLIYDGRLREAAGFCGRMADRCGSAGLHRGQGAMLANAALAHFHLGDRRAAADAAARCRLVQPRHRDPLVGAVNLTLQARLAVDLGDLGAARPLLDEAMAAGQALQHQRLQAELWALVLDLAVQAFDAREARRALSAYGEAGVRSDLDHWPAALARWLWVRGDLQGALRATDDARLGHAGLLVRAERARVLLLTGAYADAARAADAVRDHATAADMQEIARFCALVSAAARAVPDAEAAALLQPTRDSRWVHLYLGALHLDAIRRQLRGDHVGPQLRVLRARAQDVGHSLYAALAREEGW